ncbi:alpha-1-antitrypsin-like [Alligator sinensis]|uniref:Alpha-1-antitrypsin-like n=1 Tax=Alligator sinensis TaxID=38654 RepID=A0A1U7S780_ALLSI|nr:alpha-1-antitrypsin-like [Alligator sinensis]
MKSAFYLCMLLAVLHSVAHCSHEDGHDNHDANSTEHDSKHEGEAMACLKLVPNNADFAFRLYKEITLEEPNKNVFFSPVSISTAFAMLAYAARSTTQTQILEGLTFNLTEIEEREIHEGFQHLIYMLNNPDSQLQLNMGNAIFLREKLKPLQEFLEGIKNLYDTEAFTTNFKDPTEAEKQINTYVEKKTHGKIVDLVKNLDPETALVLISFIYFKGKWEKPFESEFTEERDFYVDEETTVKVPMMHRTGMFYMHFDHDLSCTVLRLHYNGSATAFFILPEKGKMKQLEDALVKETVSRWSESLFLRSAYLYIPKFSISGTYQIKNLLMKMGITDVFTNSADLSGITGTPDFKVSKVVHKAMVNVDERGSEAAAATAVEIMPLSFPPRIEFKSPFLMLIFDRVTNSTLFIGKIMNPNEK